MVYYFAYGSNLSLSRLETERLKPEGETVLSRTLGRLDGFELVFNKPSAYFIGAGAGNIQKCAGSTIYGTLNKMSPAGLKIIDKYENVATGQYERLNVSVWDVSSEAYVDAVTYIAYNNLGAELQPRSGYMAYLLEGQDILPAEYVAQLKRIPLCPELAD
ncbi:gamma-glutamylcyclotransferase [Cochlodiniinecator piscidefendens]|uniref:gamma-glutamylcyclotransferase n=1 Tax=Cochlodiniinecator piscidefendens TaxID=2715756 RepID=UPI0014095708|nr:gamma-glutamylcyclotransferase [Cochlodiniinecator piscidefendens]